MKRRVPTLAILLLLLLNIIPLSTLIQAQTPSQPYVPNTVASLTGPPIQFAETSTYIRLDFTMFIVEFYKGTTGYNVIYDRFGGVLVYDDRITLDYLSKAPDTWKQRGTPTGISWVKVNDYHYEVTRHYDDYLGTTYDVKYTVKSDSLLKITVTVKSGQTDTYRIAWIPSGIVKTNWVKTGNRLVFGDETADYGWVGFDWEDAYQSFGDITASSVESVAQGRKANIYFNIGVVSAGQTLVLDPTVVGTSTDNLATAYPFQRKSFYANGRFWVFYSDTTSTMVYRTSTKNIDWTTATSVRACSQGPSFSVWFDGTYLHYAVAYYTSIYYRRGTPNADGTITWSAVEQTVSTTYNKAYYPFVSVDTNGYVWIGYQDYLYQDPYDYYYPYVIKSGNNDGTWGTTPAGFPHQLSTTSAVWSVSIIPLTAGKMLAVYAQNQATIKVKRWTGSAWGTEKATTTAVYYGNSHSAVAQGDDVHLCFLTTSNNNLYTKYVYSSDNFPSETSLGTSASVQGGVIICRDPSTNNLYVFYTIEIWGEVNRILYRKYIASTATWEAAISRFYEVLTDNNLHTCFYNVYNNYVGYVYMQSLSSPYNVKFDVFEATVNAVGTSTTTDALYFGMQRKSFYAAGRFWVFYSDGTNMVYKTSTDGSTWTAGGSSPVRAAGGGTFSVWFDGTYLYYVYGSGGAGAALFCRRGTPISDGTINWSAVEQTAVAGVGAPDTRPRYPFISSDSSGYMWISYQRLVVDGSTVITPFVTKSGNNDGTWGTTPAGFPFQLSTTSNDWHVTIIPLTAGKMFVIYVAGAVTVRSKRWDGNAWGTERATTSTSSYNRVNSIVAQGDDAHLAFVSSSGITYVKYTYSSDAWGTETVLQSSAGYLMGVVISIDSSTNNLYVFWTNAPEQHCIYYRKWNGAIWEIRVDWINEQIATIYRYDAIPCFYQAYGSKIGIAYETEAVSPYNVKFAFLSLNQPPTNDACTATSTFDVDVYGWVNATVTDPNGVADLNTVDNQVTTSDSKAFTLRWTQSTGVFSEVSDASSICTLDASNSVRVNIDSDTDKIAFRFKISAGALTGYCSVQVTSTDDASAQDQDTYTNKFSINFYLSITINDGTHGWTGLSPGSSNAQLNSGGGSDGDVDVTVTSNGAFSLQARGGGALTSGSETIPLGNIKVHATTLASAASLTTIYANIGGLTSQARGENLSKSFILWITVPNPCAAGTYTYTLYMQGVSS